MGVKCTKQLIRDAIVKHYNTQLENVQGTTQSIIQFNNAVNSLTEYFDTLDIPSDLFKVHMPAKGVYSPVLHAIEYLHFSIEEGKVPLDLFVTANTDKKVNTFLDPALYNDSKKFTSFLLEQGLDPKVVTTLINLYAPFRASVNENLDFKPTLYTNKVLPLLYGANKVGENYNFHLPQPIIFSMLTQLVRWYSTDGQRSLEGFTQDQIEAIVDYAPGEIIPSEVYQAFEGKPSGSLRHESAMQIGSLIYKSLNIKSNTPEYGKDVDYLLRYNLGFLALEIGKKVGILNQHDIKYQRVSANKTTTEQYSYYAINDAQGINVEEISKDSEKLDDFFGTAQDFNTPSLTPNTNEVVKPKGAIGKVGEKVRELFKQLNNTKWTVNDSFHLFMVGADTDNVALRKKAVLLRQKLAGIVDTTDSSLFLHTDLIDSIKAKNEQLQNDIKAVKRYFDSGLIHEFYLKWQTQNQHRMMILSDLNPHSSKTVHRFLVRPKAASRVSIDPNSNDANEISKFHTFKIAVAQHFDLSIDKTDLVGSLKLYESVVADLADETSALSRAVSATSTLKDNEVSEEAFVDAMLELTDKYPKGNTALLIGVKALAQLETGTAFETDIVLEADAVTSGYSIGLLQFASKSVDVMKKELNRVGYTFDDDATPYSQQVQNIDGATPDGYLNFANALLGKFENLGEYTRLYSENAIKAATTKFNLFNHIYMPLVTNRRNTGKPPFMVLNYSGGVFSVSRETAGSFHTDLLKHIGALQKEYSAKDTSTKRKAEIVVRVRELSVNINNILNYEKAAYNIWVKPEEVKAVLDSGTLHTIPMADLSQGSEAIDETLKKALTDTLVPAIKQSKEETIVNTEAIDYYTQLAEFSFFLFMRKYQNEVHSMDGRTEYNLLPGDRDRITQELIKYFPRIQLKHHTDEKGTAFIDLVKTKKSQSKRIIELPFKDESPQLRPVVYTYDAAGAASVVRSIQGFDASALQSTLMDLVTKDGQVPVIPIHDAMIGTSEQLYKGKDSYNSHTVEQQKLTTLLGTMESRFLDHWKELTKKEKAEVNDDFLKQGHVNKSKDAADKISITDVLTQHQSTLSAVTYVRQELFEEIDKGTVENMYVPHVDLNNTEITSEALQEQLDEGKEDYQHSSHYKTLHDHQELFRKLESRLQALYPNVELTATEDLVDKYGNEVLGKAIGAAAYYSKGKAALDTVPHEYAHIYLNMLEHTTDVDKIIKRTMKHNKVDRVGAKEILATAMGERFTDEVLGKEAKIKVSLAKRIWKIIKSIFTELFESTSAFEQRILSYDLFNDGRDEYYNLYGDFKKGTLSGAIRTTPKKGTQKQDVETILQENPEGAKVIKKVQELIPSALVTGSLALTAFGNIYRKGKGALHDLDFRVDANIFRGGTLKKLIHSNFKNSEIIYNIGDPKRSFQMYTVIVPPENVKVQNIKRYQDKKDSRVVYYELVDVNNNKTVGTYNAKVAANPAKPKGSSTVIVDESTVGIKATLVDFMASDTSLENQKMHFSSTLGAGIRFVHPRSVFAKKGEIKAFDRPRAKDVLDFNLYAPTEVNGITPPNMFSSEFVGSSFNEMLDDMVMWHQNAPVTQQATQIFKDLGSIETHPDKEHTKHLHKILQSLVLDHIQNVDDVLVETGFVEGATTGGFSEDLRKVVVQLNKNTPVTYAEQGGQEVYVHELLHSVIDHVLKSNPRLKDKLNKLHKEAMPHISVNTFLAGGVKSNSQAEVEVAQKQYKYVSQNSTEFLIYALTNKNLTNTLKKVKVAHINKAWSKDGTFFDKLIHLYNYIKEQFNTRVRHKKMPTAEYEKFYNFALEVATINETHKRNLLRQAKEHHLSQLVFQSKDKIADFIIDAAHIGAQKLAGDTPVGNMLKNIAALPPSIKKAATERAFGKAFVALSETEQAQTVALMTKELVTGTGSLRASQLVLKAKALVESQRFHRAKSMALALRKAVKSKKVTRTQQTALTATLLKPDLRALYDSNKFTIDDIVELIKDPALLQKTIRHYELQVGTANDTFYRLQVQELAKFMNNTETKSSLQALSAHRMYQLHQQLYKKEVDVTKDASTIQAIDILVSLKALKYSPEKWRTSTLEVIDKEFEADPTDNLVHSIIKMHSVTHNAARRELFNTEAPYSMVKGYTRSKYNPDVDIITAPLTEAKALAKEGYVLEEEVGEIRGITSVKYGVFINKFNPEAPRTTGIVSYTSQRSKGTTVFELLSKEEKYQKKDPITGNMIGDPRKIKPIIDAFIKQQITKLENEVISGKLNKESQLVPLYDKDGGIYDFRVMMSSAHQERLLKPDSRFETVLTQMEMHQVDKKNSARIEKEAVQYMVDTFNAHYKDKHDKRFVNLLDKKNKAKYFIYLPKSTQQRILDNAIETKEGPVFPVVKEELHILFGFKDLRLMDIPGIQKLPASVRKGLTYIEKALLTLTSIAVGNIILKHPEVLADNIFSNTLMLMVNGVNPVKAVKGQVRAAQDLRSFKRTAAELIETYYKFMGDQQQNADLENRIVALRRELNENPIAELMDEHLFTSMVEEIHLDEYSTVTTMSQKVEDTLGKYLPESFMKAGKLAYMSKTTAPHRAVLEVFQMSDFLARVVLNDHLKKAQPNLTKEARLAILYDTFVLYDIPGVSRTAHYINKSGFILFFQYWYKIQRAVFKTLGRQPANVMLLLGLQEYLDVDVPDIYDSAIIGGNFAPPIAGPEALFEEVFRLPGVDIVTEL